MIRIAKRTSHIILLTLFIFAFSCSKPEKQKLIIEVQKSKTVQKQKNTAKKKAEPVKKKFVKDANTLIYGIKPWTKDKDMLKKSYAPLMSYLSEKMQHQVQLFLATDNKQLKTLLQDDTIDIANFSSSMFVDTLEKTPNLVQYLCTVKRKNALSEVRSYYKGYIFVKANSNIKTLKDMQGKTIGFTKRNSSSGYRFPVALLLQNGIRPEKVFQAILFLGGHDDVFEAVANGNVDVGAAGDLTFNQRKNDYGGDTAFRILLQTRPIPSDTIVVRKNLEASLVKKFKNALLKIDANSKTKDGSLVIIDAEGFPHAGFEAKNPAYYNIIRETKKILKNYKPK